MVAKPYLSVYSGAGYTLWRGKPKGSRKKFIEKFKKEDAAAGLRPAQRGTKFVPMTEKQYYAATYRDYKKRRRK